ncbi:MAG: hypothetical protein ABL986_00880 [Vicinamibacterales bacterium]
MSSRKARLSLLGFLLVVGAAAVYLGFDTYQRHAQVFARERAVLARLDAMLASVNELAVTQRGYFEPSRGGTSNGSSGPQFQRVRQLTDELRESLNSLRTQLTEPEALEQISALAAALDDFSRTDTRVRTNLANDTYFSAADLVFTASATELRSVTSALIALKDLTSNSSVSQYDTLQRRAGLIVAGLGLVWTVGLLLLALPGAPVPVQDGLSSEQPGPTTAAPHVDPEPVPVAETPVTQAAMADPEVDLDRAARACVAMARASSAAELREVLASAADSVRASGMIVWLGAGEELFPVLAHGYDPRMLSRIGPLARQASNAAARAWRGAEMQIVDGEQGRAGAIIVPLVSTQGCIGVVSAELPSGRERELAAQSVTTMFAAQLSTIVAAWPEPSADALPGPIAITL